MRANIDFTNVHSALRVPLLQVIMEHLTKNGFNPSRREKTFCDIAEKARSFCLVLGGLGIHSEYSTEFGWNPHPYQKAHFQTFDALRDFAEIIRILPLNEKRVYVECGPPILVHFNTQTVQIDDWRIPFSAIREVAALIK